MTSSESEQARARAEKLAHEICEQTHPHQRECVEQEQFGRGNICPLFKVAAAKILAYGSTERAEGQREERGECAAAVCWPCSTGWKLDESKCWHGNQECKAAGIWAMVRARGSRSPEAK